MSGITGYPLQSQCTVLQNLCSWKNSFVPWWMPVLSPRFLRTWRHQAKVVMCFLNVSDLPLWSSKIISRKGGYKPSVYDLLFCIELTVLPPALAPLPTALCCVSWYPLLHPSLASSIGAGCCWEYRPDNKNQMSKRKCVHEAAVGKKSWSKLISFFSVKLLKDCRWTMDEVVNFWEFQFNSPNFPKSGLKKRL